MIAVVVYFLICTVLVYMIFFGSVLFFLYSAPSPGIQQRFALNKYFIIIVTSIPDTLLPDK